MIKMQPDAVYEPTYKLPDYEYLDTLNEEELEEYWIEEGRVQYRHEWFAYTANWD